MAIGNIHIGTIAGKLNGVIPATTPRGWRMLYVSTPSRPAPKLTLHQLGHTACELDHLDAALEFTRRIIEESCRARRADRFDDLFDRAVEDLAVGEHDPLTFHDAVCHATQRRRRFRTQRPASTSAMDARATSAVVAPVAGS